MWSSERLLDIVPSHYNTCEFCQGTISEMIEEDEGMYDAITQYASQDKISYVHFRVRCIIEPPSTLWAIHPCGFPAPRNRPTPMRTAERHRSGPGVQ